MDIPPRSEIHLRINMRDKITAAAQAGLTEMTYDATEEDVASVTCLDCGIDTSTIEEMFAHKKDQHKRKVHWWSMWKRR